VIDLNKEIKLSDLVRKTAKASERSKSSAPRDKASRPPAFGRKSKARELVGLKIGATQLAAAVVVNGDSPRVVKLARQPLPPGIVGDGEVRDVAALAAGVEEFFWANGLPRRRVRLGIATNHVGVRTFDIAGIDDERQLANAVLFRAHDAVSIPVDEAVIDYRVVNETIDETGAIVRRILLVAAYREPIERYAAAFRQAGVQLAGVDLEAFALLRAVAGPPPEDAAPAVAVVAVNVGFERTTLAVSDGLVCEFTRVLRWGGTKLAAALESELRGRPGEGRERLLELSFEPDESDALRPDEPEGRAREAARHELHGLARELVTSLEYYQSQPESLPISEILISGGTTRIPGFVAELERLTRVRVRQADPLGRVQVDKAVEKRDDLASLAIAIGLGVDD
jgi:type IV pilus assembly protein PilM